MQSMRERGRKSMMFYASIFRSIFEKFMGGNSLTVLEYQLSKRCPGVSPYELLLEDPEAFYKALIQIFGAEGSLLFLRLVFKQIVNGYELTEFSPDELAESFVRGKDEARTMLLKLLERLSTSDRGCLQGS